MMPDDAGGMQRLTLSLSLALGLSPLSALSPDTTSADVRGGGGGDDAKP